MSENAFLKDIAQNQILKHYYLFSKKKLYYFIIIIFLKKQVRGSLGLKTKWECRLEYMGVQKAKSNPTKGKGILGIRRAGGASQNM